jgi:predicted TIM-barrel fold metal-dependent hydrolase
MSTTGLFANHAHVFPAEIKPNGTIDRLLRLLDACGIEQAVCFAPFAYQVQRASTPVDPNPWLAAQLRNQPRLMGFGTIDFTRDDLETQVRSAADLGFRGLKLHPNVQHFSILEERARRVYREAERLGLFCTFHTGMHHSRLRDARVIDFDDVAFDFPRLRFSLEHLGGYHFFNEALAVLANHDLPAMDGHRRSNVFGGLTSIFTRDTNRPWDLAPDKLLEALAQAGPDQLIFGLDFPYNLEPETTLALNTLRSLDLPAADLQKILGQNLRDLMAANR